MKHDIPPWFIPDGEKIVTDIEGEREQLEEHGEIREPLCPHCGEPYLEKSDTASIYIHKFGPHKSNGPLGGTSQKPTIVCTSNKTRNHINGLRRYEQ